jgi:Fic family protein
MQWNWQQSAWPRFSWSARLLDRAEQRFLVGRGVLLGATPYLAADEQQRLTVELVSEEALTTSAIEGEILDRASVQSSVRRQLGLAADSRKATDAERGIAELMIGLYRTAADPLDEATLCSWHAMLLQGRHGLRDLGRYRTHDDPMQVVSGRIDAPKVHFEAPPSTRVAAEMRAFVEWFNATAPDRPDALPAVTRAGIAHLYFESIHPFEDGNGRIGRAISEKALAQVAAQSAGAVAITSLAATILMRRREYYEHLEAASRSCEISEWLRWFAGVALEAQHRTRVQVEFLIDKARFLDGLRDRIDERQRRVLERVLREGPRGFSGGLSAGNYATIAKVSPATATRDLASLVEEGALERRGERRHARYHPRIALREVPRVTIDAEGNPVETARA